MKQGAKRYFKILIKIPFNSDMLAYFIFSNSKLLWIYNLHTRTHKTRRNYDLYLTISMKSVLRYPTHLYNPWYLQGDHIVFQYHCNIGCVCVCVSVYITIKLKDYCRLENIQIMT